MDKSLADGFRRAIYIGLLACSLACAQEVTTSMSYSWDQPSGDFYAYAQSTLDHASSYYYYVCVYVDLGQSSTDSFTFAPSSCDDEDAEVNWYTSVDTSTPLTIDLESENDVYMNYYADQFEEGWPDGYCWDAYQVSYFDGTVDESGGTDYFLPGRPARVSGSPTFPCTNLLRRSLAISRSAPAHSRANTVAVGRKICRLRQIWLPPRRLVPRRLAQAHARSVCPPGALTWIIMIMIPRGRAP
jgi:hypothetical protein